MSVIQLIRLPNTPSDISVLQIVSTQMKGDSKLRDLLDAINESCEFADLGEKLGGFSKRNMTIINRILQQIVQCIYFMNA